VSSVLIISSPECQVTTLASVHPLTRRRIAVDRNHPESLVVPVSLSLSLSVNKDGWSMKQTTHHPFTAVQRNTTSTSLFIVGLLHLWTKTPPIDLGELNSNVFTGLLETFRCSSY